MLGQYIQHSSLFQEDNIIGVNRITFPDFDFCNSNEALKIIKSLNPDVVINCVAITSIEICQQDKKLADDVNAITPGLISEFCLKENIFFLSRP